MQITLLQYIIWCPVEGKSCSMIPSSDEIQKFKNFWKKDVWLKKIFLKSNIKQDHPVTIHCAIWQVSYLQYQNYPNKLVNFKDVFLDRYSTIFLF